MTSISTFCFRCADCFPEKAIQILAEAWEHSREIVHHGKQGLPKQLSARVESLGGLASQNRTLGKQTFWHWELAPQLLNYWNHSLIFLSVFWQYNFDPSNSRKNK